MNYKDLIKKEKYFISFKSFAEVDNPNVALRINIYGSDNETDLLLKVRTNVDVWQIDFPSYATYSVTFEDFTTIDSDEIYEGSAFRIYETSRLMDFLKKETNLEAQELNRGKLFQHFSLACMENQVDIISNDQPIVKLLSRSNI